MKKYILIVAIACIALVAPAQTADAAPRAKKELKTPEERAIHQTKKMTERYGLDALQSERLLEATRTRIAQEESLRAQDKAMKEERKAQRAARKAAHDRYMNEVREVMTAEQFASFEKDIEARKAKRKEQRAAKKAAGKQ